jgi:hypothetical protein
MLRRRVPAHLRVPLLLATAALTLTGLASAAALVGPDRAGAIVVDAFHGPSAAPASRPMTPVQRARPGTAVVSTRPPATSAERAVPPAAITGQHLPSARPPGSAPPPKALAPPIPPVAPLATLIRPDLLVLSPTQISGPDRDRLTHSSGVQSTLALTTGQVQLQQTAVRGIAVDPGTFRNWTPRLTAQSDGLWRSVASGEFTTSFDLGKNLRLPLGGYIPLQGAPGTAGISPRLGALASMNLPGVYLTVSELVGNRLAFTPDAAMLVSAPDADLIKLRAHLRSVLGPRAQILLLRDTPAVRGAGSTIGRTQVATVLQTALSKLGAPYVYGANGPNAFDCSSLVQYAFAAAGVGMPRTSEQQWLVGRRVPLQQALPGDLLFWASDPNAPDDVDHVAIYLGGGKFVSAPHTGDVVHIGPFYGQGFRGVVRVDPGNSSRLSSSG